MNPDQILAELQMIAHEGDFAAKAGSLVETWRSAPNSNRAIEPILIFMERNPAVDFGTPGPLVHFVERFYRQGYEQSLMESVTRQPIPHTVWMLNRILNGAKTEKEKTELSAVLGGVLTNPAANEESRQLAQQFLRRQ